MKKNFIFFCLIFTIAFLITACGDDDLEATEETDVAANGQVDSAEDFIKLGFLIDVEESDMISNVSYSISNDEIAIVGFIYNGISCELRGSTVYSGYELAGVEGSADSNIVVTSIGGYNATYYKLSPGRLVTWTDGEINYCLYVYVTADDSVLNSIVPYLIFENHYDEREDVKSSTETAGAEFAEKIVTIVQNRDLEGLSEIMNYPQQLESGESVANKSELLALSEDVVFTDKLVDAVNTEALSDLRLSQDEASYIVGSNNKNVYFRLMDDGTFKVIKINN